MQFSQTGFSTSRSRVGSKPSYDFPAFRVDARPTKKGKATSVWMNDQAVEALGLEPGVDGNNHLTFLTDYVAEGRLFAFASGDEGELRFGKNQKASNKKTYANIVDVFKLDDSQETVFELNVIEDTFNGKPVVELVISTATDSATEGSEDDTTDAPEVEDTQETPTDQEAMPETAEAADSPWA